MKNIKQYSWFHFLILLCGIICIGWSAIFVKIAGISGLGSAFYRMLIGSIGILPIWFFHHRPIKDFKSIRIAALCGIIFASDIALWNTSILLTKAAIATLIANLAPVWVGLIAVFILKEKQKPLFWTGTIISLIGVVIIVGITNILHSSLNTGNLLAIGASLFYAMYLLITRTGRNSLDTVTFTAISMISSTIVLYILCLFFHIKLTNFPSSTWYPLAGLGLISQLGGWLAINYALGYIKPTIASVSLLSQSVFTAIFAVPVLGEYLNLIEIVGAIIVLIGIYMVNRKIVKPTTSIEPEY